MEPGCVVHVGVPGVLFPAKIADKTAHTGICIPNDPQRKYVCLCVRVGVGPNSLKSLGQLNAKSDVEPP